MNKPSKIFLVIIIILLVILAIMIVLYLHMRNSITNITNSTNMTRPNSNVVINNNIVLKNDVSKEKDYSIDTNKVKIEIDESTITPISISIIIINNNENQLFYGEEFKIQKNVNGNWKYIDYVSDKLYWNSIAMITKGKSQTTSKLDIEHYYGKLDNGIYRVEKNVNGNSGGVSIYSNEFEIK